ncbi:MAG: lipid-binding protein [Bacteroidales bacterium]
MKKILYTTLIVAFAMIFASCEKNPIPMTAVEAMAGDWYVTCDGADENGNVIEGWEDPFGVGEWHTFTYNTSANLPTEMYVSDGKDADDWYFWTYTVKVSVDLATMTFKSNGPVHNEAYDCDVTITNGKITLNGATTPSGQPADAIEYCIVFSDDSYVGQYWSSLKVHGYRYTGFLNDD